MYRHDEPIELPEEDKLSRNNFSCRLGDAILQSPTKSGYVISLNGEWGTGKTSVIRLTQHYLRSTSKTVMLEFNPWIINDSQRIIPEFLSQLQHLKLDRSPLTNYKIQNEFRKYALAVLPPATSILTSHFPAIAPAVSFLKRANRALKKKETESSNYKKTKIKIIEALKEKQKRIVVFIDDIDRLEIKEIEEVSKLVRLVADFPFITYVLAFDEEIVSKSLNSKYSGGSDYLEKIIQQKIDLPEVHEEALRSYLLMSLNDLMSDLKDDIYFDDKRWPNLYWKIVDPRIKNVRDVNRLMNSLRFICTRIGNRIDLVDLIGLETLRILDFGVYEDINRLRQFLHKASWGTYSVGANTSSPTPRAKIESALKHVDLAGIEPILSELFPATASALTNMQWAIDPSIEWHLKRRVASKELFELFTTNTESKELSNRFKAEDIFALIQQGRTLEDLILDLTAEDLTQVINSFVMFAGKIEISKTVEVIITILRAIPRMSVTETGFFSIDATSIVRKTISALLVGIEDQTERDYIVKAVNKSDLSLSELNIFIYTVSNYASKSLISETLRIEINEEFNERVLSCTISDLLAERDFISIMYSVPKYVQQHMQENGFIIEVFKHSVGLSQISEVGSGGIARSPFVSWPALISLFGSEKQVFEKLDSILTSSELGENDRKILNWIRAQRGKNFPLQEQFN